ncbi:MAG: flavin reductase family protein [Bacteroidota bacterium]
MLVIDPQNTPTSDLHQYLLSAVAPRPIAFASTIDETGQANLAPYSFFNCFSSNPPILVFSSNRKVSDNTTKDTLHNIQKTKEVVINVVNYRIVRQMTVTSIAFPTGVSEFEKSGLSPIPSDLIRPFRVKESPVQMECRVKDIIALGDQGGAGHLIICEVVRMHVDENVLDEKGKIDPHKIDLMGRMGRAFYVRASGDAIHKIFQAVPQVSIGYDQLPPTVRLSKVLSGNNLGQLAGLLAWPDESEAKAIMAKDQTVQEILSQPNSLENLHQYAKEILDADDSRRAYAAAVVMIADMA